MNCSQFMGFLRFSTCSCGVLRWKWIVAIRVAGSDSPILTMNQELPLAIARHLPRCLNGLGLSACNVACALPAFAKRSPLIAALNYVNVVAICHLGVLSKLTK